MPAITTMAIGAGIGMLDSYLTQRKAQKQLKAMEGKMPQYRTVQDIEREAKTMAQGFTPEEMSAAKQGQARAAAAGYRLGTQTNPNLAGAVQSGINYATIASTADLAAKDAQMRQQNQNRFFQNLMTADLRKTGEERQLFGQAAQQYGLAIQQARQNRMNYLQALIYGAGQTTPTAKTTPKTATTETPSVTNRIGLPKSEVTTQGQLGTQSPLNMSGFTSPYGDNYFKPY